MAVLVLAILLFIFEWVRVDVVGIIMMIILPLLGLVTPKEAISGLSSNAVVSIIAVIIIGAGLDKTGAMNSLARVLLKFAGKSESRIMILISGTVAFISSFMQNIGAAALFMPAAKRICRQTNIPVSRILMPMGFCAIIGGCITLIGSSPLILMNDVMKISDPNVEPFGLFAVTPIGLALIIAALIYFVLLGRFILPTGQGDEAGSGSMSQELQRTYQDIGTLFEIQVPESFEGPKTLEELEIRPIFFTTVLGIASQGGTSISSPDYSDTIKAGDTIVVEGPPDLVAKMAQSFGWQVKEDLEVFAESLSPNNAGIMEAIITPRSELVGNTLRLFSFRKKNGVNPLAVFRENKTFVGGISTMQLRAGDALLLQGDWEKFHYLKERTDLVFTEEVQGEILRTDKVKFAVGGLVLALIMILGFHVQLSIALLAGAMFMILTKVLSIDEAYDSVDWMTVFLLGGLIPLGIAFEKTGAANLIARNYYGGDGHCFPADSSDRHRHTDLIFHSGCLKCRRNGTDGSPCHEYGRCRRRRSTDRGPGGGGCLLKYLYSPHPPGQRPDYASGRIQNKRLFPGRGRDDHPLSSGDDGLHSCILRCFGLTGGVQPVELYQSGRQS